MQVLGERPLLLENRTKNEHRWIGVQLVGMKSNRDAVGAAVTIRKTNGISYHFASRTGSYMSANDSRVLAGLGNDEPMTIEIRWPSGRTQSIERPRYNKYVKITEPE